MYRIYLICLLYVISAQHLAAQDQQKEVLIIGTMHQVPKTLKNSYRPLYKAALSYEPDAIYVETAMPDDDESWAYLKDGYSNFLRDFYSVSDSMRQAYDFDAERHQELFALRYSSLQTEDIRTLLRDYLYLRDAANFKLYKYVQKYGLDYDKSLRNEDNDLSHRLAIHLGHREIYATDDQRTNAEFHEAYAECVKTTANTSTDKKAKKINRKLTWRAIGPSIFGRYGINGNKTKNLILLDSLSAMRYSTGAHESCDLAIDYWDQRNHRIAKNLAEQILKSDRSKHLLVIGGAHVIGIQQELSEQYPQIKVILMDDL